MASDEEKERKSIDGQNNSKINFLFYFIWVFSDFD